MGEILNLDELDVGGKEPFEFVFDGETYQCASMEELDARDMVDFRKEADEDPMAMLRQMLDDEQVQRLYEAEAVFTLTHLRAVSEAWAAHYGMDMGKSGGSRASRRTSKPKRR